MNKKSAYSHKGLLIEIFRKAAKTRTNKKPICYNNDAMNKCTDCQRPSPITRTDYRKRGANGEWEIIIRPDEHVCPKCAAKRGARNLQQIHDER